MKKIKEFFGNGKRCSSFALLLILTFSNFIKNNIKKKQILILALLSIGFTTQANAACQWTSFQKNGVYAYGFEVGVNQNGSINSIQLYLGTYIGSMASKTDTITYNGQVYGLGAFRDKICLGKNCTSERWEYEACTVAPAVTYSYTTTQDQNVACPADRPSGYIVQRRSYEVWSDGSARNFGGWYNVADYCSAVRSYIQPQTRSYACPSGQSGQITQSRTYEVWTDGSIRNYTAWNVSGNTCAMLPITTNPIKRRENCPEGYTGYIQYHWVIYYTNDSYSAYDGDGKLITYTLSTPHQQELVESNNCVLIPSQTVTTTPGSQTVSCDTYYNVTKGTYLGNVIKYGNYVASYNSTTKQTNTVFNLTSTDVTQCLEDPEKTISTESITAACDSGQTGIITKSRYVATDTKGVKSYPYGTDYIVMSNTCIGTSPDTDTGDSALPSNKSLIENLTLTSSLLSDQNYSNQMISMLKSQEIKPEEIHRFNLVINDLSVGKYNPVNVTNVLRAFKAAVGENAQFRITLPQSIDKYVGNGAIKEGQGLSISSAVVNGNQLKLTYIGQFDKSKLSMPVEQTVNIPLFSGDLTGIVFGKD